MIGLFYQMVTAIVTQVRQAKSQYLLGGGLIVVPVCNMASKLMKHNYIAQMSLKLESTFREFKLYIVLWGFRPLFIFVLLDFLMWDYV